MGKTARKLNFLREESICRDLEVLVPSGQRSNGCRVKELLFTMQRIWPLCRE